MGAVGLAPRRLGVPLTMAAGLVAAAATGALALGVLFVGGLRLFGLVHLTYLGLVVAIPMVGVATAVRTIVDPAPDSGSEAVPDLGSDPRSGARSGLSRRVPGSIAATVLLLPAVVGWYATHIEPNRLTVDRATVAVPPERQGDDPVRIGVLADLQTDDVGDHERRAVDRLLAEQPDLILLPGDLFQGSEQSFAEHEAELRDLLGRLAAPHGVYFVRGDVDHGDYADRALRGSGVVILDDRVVDLRVGDRRVRIGGNRLRYADPPAVAVRRELESVPAEDEAGTGDEASGDAAGAGAGDDGTIRILVAHRPDAVLDLASSSRVDLTVAGHTHGGQVVVPGFGPLVTMSGVPRGVGAGGLHELDGNRIYVATGVGLERGQAPQVRFFSPPTIGILDLR